MPWCEECARYLVPNAMNPDGTCPRCGSVAIRSEHVTGASIDLRTLAGADESRAPWHFRVLVVLLVAYLAWRLVDLIV